MDVTAMAASAGNSLVSAAVTDAREDVRLKIAGIFGRGKPDPLIELRFDATRAALQAAVSPADAGKTKQEQAASWTARLTVLLEDHPEASGELDRLAREIKAGASVASDHAVAAGRLARAVRVAGCSGET
jgi:hypothetical protein